MQNTGADFTPQGGFTLVELMVTLAISSIVMIAVFTTFQNQQKSYGIQEEVVVMQQNLRAAMNLITQELRMASYSPINRNGEISTAQSNLLIFTHEIDNLGTSETIQYDLYDAYGDGDSDLGRQIGINATTKRAVAENIDALEFVYLDANGSPLTNLNTQSDRDLISTIQISILARSAKADPGFVNTFDYFPASCPQAAPPAAVDDSCLTAVAWTALAPTWNFDGDNTNNSNAFNDNFRRRLLTATVDLRN